jgi:hypothetical protein
LSYVSLLAMTATATVPFLDPPNANESIRRWLALKTVELWEKAVDAFREWERDEILCKTPSPQDLERHREDGAWLIRETRHLQSMVNDPQFPVPECQATVDGRLYQLDLTYREVHDAMTDAEADAILKQAFPDAPGTGQPR